MSLMDRLVDKALGIEKPEDKPKTYRLSFINDRNSGQHVNIKSIVQKFHRFKDIDFTVGRSLLFRDIDEPLGYRDEGEIKSVRTETIRKREYIVVSTKIRDFYLTEHQRQG
jgi:hypothetical protein